MSTVKVKICGITNREDALKAVSLGASALGFIFAKQSPRFVSPYKVKKIVAELPPFVTPVGVFVNQNEGAIKDMAELCGITALQFHGDETPEYCRRFSKFKLIKAFRVGEQFDISGLGAYPVSAFLMDTYEEGKAGGTGQTFNWELIKNKKLPKPVILSGGLNPGNIKEAIQSVWPYAVDASSGLEKEPGVKDQRLLEEFFAKIKSASL